MHSNSEYSRGHCPPPSPPLPGLQGPFSGWRIAPTVARLLLSKDRTQNGLRRARERPEHLRLQALGRVVMSVAGLSRGGKLDPEPHSRVEIDRSPERCSQSMRAGITGPLNFYRVPRLIFGMRPSAFRLFVLLIAWCVGFQSTATAMGMRCAHGKMAVSESSAAMPAGMHHGGMAMPMDQASPAAHQHHHMGSGTGPAADAKVSTSKIGCQCGCNCMTVGCAGGGPGIVSLSATRFFVAAPVAFPLHEAPSRLRSAHGLDLIRPPSMS